MAAIQDSTKENIDVIVLAVEVVALMRRLGYRVDDGLVLKTIELCSEVVHS